MLLLPMPLSRRFTSLLGLFALSAGAQCPPDCSSKPLPNIDNPQLRLAAELGFQGAGAQAAAVAAFDAHVASGLARMSDEQLLRIATDEFSGVPLTTLQELVLGPRNEAAESTLARAPEAKRPLRSLSEDSLHFVVAAAEWAETGEPRLYVFPVDREKLAAKRPELEATLRETVSRGEFLAANAFMREEGSFEAFNLFREVEATRLASPEHQASFRRPLVLSGRDFSTEDHVVVRVPVASTDAQADTVASLFSNGVLIEGFTVKPISFSSPTSYFAEARVRRSLASESSPSAAPIDMPAALKAP
jgi:hypothetical protein